MQNKIIRLFESTEESSSESNGDVGEEQQDNLQDLLRDNCHGIGEYSRSEEAHLGAEDAEPRQRITWKEALILQNEDYKYDEHYQ